MPSIDVDSIVEFKGYADLIIAGILTFSPQLLYESPLMQLVHRTSGLQISNGIAPDAVGFNQAIACMVAAIGVGQIVSARMGPSNPFIFLSMYATWGVLSLATCLTEMGSATVLFTGINHLAFTGVIWYFHSRVQKKPVKGE
ncbi:hypothetical protein DL96DRAFT_1454369 [Flagelloscypha sp. PMI_526]|nr:hypothetical protein DL96DRAFT_1454369 [Flagelloscypha sp. PMI_526]